MTCCLNCEDRIIGCHSVCNQYKKQREKVHIININKQKRLDFDGYMSINVYKTKKKLKLI